MIPHHAHLSPSSPSSPPLHFYKYFFSPTNKIWKNLKVQENFDFLLWCTSLTQGCGLDKIKKCVSIYCYNNILELKHERGWKCGEWHPYPAIFYSLALKNFKIKYQSWGDLSSFL
jgi:hypothetical protein